MDGPIIVFALLVLVVLVIAAFMRSGAALENGRVLLARIAALEAELRQLRASAAPEPAPAPKPAPAPVAVPVVAPVQPPPLPVPSPAPVAPRPASAPRPPVNWEQFMGAKLFAWIGGLALFLGVGFFVKYSFEHNLIPPSVRVAIGFILGVALLAGGVLLKKKAYAVTAQTLCGTGVLILYVSTFAAHGFYHFPFFSVVPTFLLMALITAVAFALAVRLHAPTVAVLGMLGGFLTPVLLSTGEDRPVALFGYIALLDAGLLAVALRRRWNYLAPLGALGTAVMFAGWAENFFVRERYFEGLKFLLPMAVVLGFVTLFTAAAAWARQRGWLDRVLPWTALLVVGGAFAFGFSLLDFTVPAQRPLLLFGYFFLINLAVLALVWFVDGLRHALPVSGLIVFSALAFWTGVKMTAALLPAGLALYFIFALLHTAAPLALQRFGKVSAPSPLSQLFPALALLLALVPMLQNAELSLLVWPFVLLVDVLAIGLAVASGALLPILLVLVGTLVLTGAWIARIPPALTGLPTSLALLAGFSVFFVVAGVWAGRRVKTPAANMAALLPACSAALPFLLLIMVVARLPLVNPSPVFGVALLLIALLFALTKFLKIDALPLVGLLATLALENAWSARHFPDVAPTLALAWHLGFYAVFAIFPFVFARDFSGKVLPWAAAALAGPLHFPLVQQIVRDTWPALHSAMGLLPAAFAIPALAGVFLQARRAAPGPVREAQLAWLGGSALFFITLIFPIQFDREWITLGWALEGAALCWLFRRIPHPGLRLVGVALLVAAFARLALNPAVLAYHPRSATGLFNWYLYAYGLATVCLFAGARALAAPRDRVLGFSAPALLSALGTVLAFLLVNIEIADFFTEPGQPVLTFQFSGNLARDMSYSIAWACFALLLVVLGIRKKLAPVRYAGLGLLSVTLLKLFLHDLSQLGQLYRIGALVAVAIVAIVASFLYQRFLAADSEASREDE